MDRRLPLAIGFMGAAVAAIPALPHPSRIAVLVAVPSVLLWLGRTTVQQARAKEDNLRRIGEIERVINSIAGEELLLFQSRHPNRAKIVGGRTGMGIVFATAVSSLVMLLLCLLVFIGEPSRLPRLMYFGYLGFVGADLLIGPIRLSFYGYRKSDGPQVPGQHHTHSV